MACGCISKKGHRCCGFARDVAHAVRFFVFVVVFTWSPRLPCLCDASDIFVLHAKARICAIRVSLRNSPFLICSAHARCEPRDPREEAASMEWWMELGDVVVQHRRDGEHFLLSIDSNARVGSVVSSFVGGQKPDEESKNGEFFHTFLARTGTALLATF